MRLLLSINGRSVDHIKQNSLVITQ
uniref:Uncharacterized protein n=1 Tax=Arundo donax TaxID=35708 RepID=A0A0A8YPH8_ARUDO